IIPPRGGGPPRPRPVPLLRQAGGPAPPPPPPPARGAEGAPAGRGPLRGAGGGVRAGGRRGGARGGGPGGPRGPGPPAAAPGHNRLPYTSRYNDPDSSPHPGTRNVESAGPALTLEQATALALQIVAPPG